MASEKQREFEFTSRHGSTYEISFVRCAYAATGSLAIQAMCRGEGGGWEPYGALTVNLGGPYAEGTAHLDTNNVGDLCEMVMERGWAEQIGLDASGWCTYPLVAFSDEFLNEVCRQAR